MMVHVSPKLYHPFIMFDSKGEALVLYVKMKKALNGLLRSALLIYKHLVDALVKYGSR